MTEKREGFRRMPLPEGAENASLFSFGGAAFCAVDGPNGGIYHLTRSGLERLHADPTQVYVDGTMLYFQGTLPHEEYA